MQQEALSLTVSTEVHCGPIPPPIMGLPEDVAAWLHATHEQLAHALSCAQRDAASDCGSEMMIAVEGLPLATREFLWLGIRTHLPALAALLREPWIAEARALFQAQLRLAASDVLTVVSRAAAVANQHPINSSESP